MILHLPDDYPAQWFPNIRNGGLPDCYSFVQIHFHWGNDTWRGGSEHLIRRLRYPAEMHIVHYNAKYGSYEEAIKYPDGVAVIGVFITLERYENIAFRHLLQLFGRIYDVEQEVSLPSPVPLMDLLPDDAGDNFYRYNGNLTLIILLLLIYNL